MPGRIDYDAELPSPMAPPVLPVVYRYRPDADDGERYEPLPNVRLLGVEFFEGARVPEARFRYEFVAPSLAPPGVPTAFGQVAGVDAGGRYVVANGDRIVARVVGPDDASRLVFDGFAEIPQVNFTPNAEVVTFQAYGTPVREADEPLKGSVWRETNRPKRGEDIVTNLPARFNPKGLGNATPDGWDHYDEDRPDREEDPEGWLAALATFPVFQEPTTHVSLLVGGGTEPARARAWDLAMAARYILFSPVVNGVEPEDFGKYLYYYEPHRYDAVLNSRKPKVAGVGIDPENPATYVDTPIPVNDLDVTGDKRMEALAKLIEPHGFAFRYEIGEDDAGDPEWWLKIYRKDDAHPLKPIFLQPEGQAVDPARTNFDTLGMQRDTQQVVNAWSVDAAPTRYEAAFLLRPLFMIAEEDGDVDNLHKWKMGDPDFEPDKYRKFGLDECGEGHFKFVVEAGDVIPGAGTWETDYPVVDPDGPDAPKAGDPAPHWMAPLVGPDRKPAHLPRPGEGKLLTKDADGDRKHAELYVITEPEFIANMNDGVALLDWSQVQNLWNGTVKTQKVTKGGWELLPDRLGIRLTRPSIEGWQISEPGKFDDPFPSGLLRVASSLTVAEEDGSSVTKMFAFILVTVISDDGTLTGEADRRETSPSPFETRRRLDARGWFANEAIHRNSPYAEAVNPDRNPGVTLVRDDGPAAQAHAEARRKADEIGSIAGSFTMPTISFAYAVGDRIRGISGRTLSFRQNHQLRDEAGIYPAVVSVRWEFDGRQETVVNLNDRRADPPPERRR